MIRRLAEEGAQATEAAPRDAVKEIEDAIQHLQAQTWLGQERWTEYQTDPGPARSCDDGML